MADIGNNPLEFEGNGGITSESRAFLSISDDDFLPELHDIKEEMVEEVMQELLKEINGCNSSDDHKDTSMAPVSAPVCPSTIIVAGGHNESCGPTFSDSASTVMAGIDVSTGVIKKGGGAGSSSSSLGLVGTTEVFAGVEVVVLQSVAGIGQPWLVEGSDSTSDQCCMQGGGEKMDGCDGMEVDDEWLARILCSGPLGLEEWI